MVLLVVVFIVVVKKNIKVRSFTSFHCAVISIGIFTMTQLFPYKTEFYTLSC